MQTILAQLEIIGGSFIGNANAIQGRRAVVQTRRAGGNGYGFKKDIGKDNGEIHFCQSS